VYRAAWVALAAVLGVAVSTATLAAAPAAKPPPWQTIPGVRADLGYGASVLGWASGRFWFAPNTEQDVMPATSATIGSGRLRGFKTSRQPISPYVRLIVGSELVYSLPGNDASRLQSRGLLASGGLGPPNAVPLDLKAIAPSHAISPQAAIRVGDRTVWALPGSTREFHPRAVFWVCCAADGSAQQLTGMIDRSTPPKPVRLGLDGRGRLWLAWHDRCCVKVVELDPTTLVPRAAKATVAPGRGVERFELVCTAVCRLVIEHFNGIHSWAPGERTPTRIVGIQQRYGPPPRLLAAAMRSGKLAVAHGTSDIRVIRGNGRGARARLVGRSPLLVMPTTQAVFVPAGLVAITRKGAYDGQSAVLVDLVPVAR
jgi:hypothetical protein